VEEFPLALPVAELRDLLSGEIHVVVQNLSGRWRSPRV
jgi:hypothetical protein